MNSILFEYGFVVSDIDIEVIGKQLTKDIVPLNEDHFFEIAIYTYCNS